MCGFSAIPITDSPLNPISHSLVNPITFPALGPEVIGMGER